MRLFFIATTFTIVSFAISPTLTFAQNPTEQTISANETTETQKNKKEKSTDWFELAILIGYLGGVFVCFPIVVYTNLKESLAKPSSENPSSLSLSEDERNQKTAAILAAIEEKMSILNDDEGQQWLTITKGSQAKFIKFGLDYINKHLQPTDETLIERVKEFENVYNTRTKRIFTGSNWVLGCAIGVGVLFFFTGGISVFLIIHILGIIFYYLASRTPLYLAEKRYKWFGSGTGVIATIMTTLFVGNEVRYYIKRKDGTWERDYGSEGSEALITIAIILIVALIIGFFASLLGLLNAIVNYFSSYILPTENETKWYAKNIELTTVTNE